MTDAAPVDGRPPRRPRVAVNGWIVLDKPLGMTSTLAVGRLRWLLSAKKAGHAGTLDPLASGVLPIAFGEATKTIPFVQDGEKRYEFTVRWGAETSTDDAEGPVVASSDARPQRAAIEAALPGFVGTILQRPPAFSAIRIDGERAYDLARDGEAVEIAPREVIVHSLAIVAHEENATRFVATCGKGVYVRAIARDLGRLLGCYGHISALRRTRVGPFEASDAAPWPALEDRPEAAALALKPVEAGLAGLPCVAIDRTVAARLRNGQSALLRGRDAPVDGVVWAACLGEPVAFGEIREGALHPARVFNFGG